MALEIFSDMFFLRIIGDFLGALGGVREKQTSVDYAAFLPSRCKTKKLINPKNPKPAMNE